MELFGIILFIIGFCLGGSVIWAIRQNEIISIKKGQNQLKESFGNLSNEALIANQKKFIELAENEYFRAAIDVYPVEPVPADSTFRKKSNILFTSHVAGALDYSYKNIRDMMMNDIKKILNGMPPIHLQHADPDKAIMRRDR